MPGVLFGGAIDGFVVVVVVVVVGVVVVVVGVVVATGVTLEFENVIFPLFGMLNVNLNISPFPVIEWLRMVAGFFTFGLQLAVDLVLSITPPQTASLKVQLIVCLPAFTSPFTLTTLTL